MAATNGKEEAILANLKAYFEGFMDADDAAKQARHELNMRIAWARQSGATLSVIGNFFGKGIESIRQREARGLRRMVRPHGLPAYTATHGAPYTAAQLDAQTAANRVVIDAAQQEAERAAERQRYLESEEFKRNKMMSQINTLKAEANRLARMQAKWEKEHRQLAVNAIINRERRKAFNEGRRLSKEEENAIIERDMTGWECPPYERDDVYVVPPVNSFKIGRITFHKL